MQLTGFKVLAEHFFKTANDPTNPINLLSLINILVLWHVVRLIQLKQFNIWLSVYFFGIWTLALCVNGFRLLMLDIQFANLVSQLAVFAALNIICLMYLIRPSFQQFAAQFVAERVGPEN